MHPGEIRQGDLYWLSVEETGGSIPAIPHPHVVVQDDVFNRSRVKTVIVCALTTNRRRAGEPGNVTLEPGEGNLPRPSVIVVSQVPSVYRIRLVEYIGSLAPHRVQAVLEGMRFQQASFFTRGQRL